MRGEVDKLIIIVLLVFLFAIGLAIGLKRGNEEMCKKFFLSANSVETLAFTQENCK